MSDETAPKLTERLIVVASPEDRALFKAAAAKETRKFSQWARIVLRRAAIEATGA